MKQMYKKHSNHNLSLSPSQEIFQFYYNRTGGHCKVNKQRYLARVKMKSK